MRRTARSVISEREGTGRPVIFYAVSVIKSLFCETKRSRCNRSEWTPWCFGTDSTNVWVEVEMSSVSEGRLVSSDFLWVLVKCRWEKKKCLEQRIRPRDLKLSTTSSTCPFTFTGSTGWSLCLGSMINSLVLDTFSWRKLVSHHWAKLSAVSWSASRELSSDKSPSTVEPSANLTYEQQSDLSHQQSMV